MFLALPGLAIAALYFLAAVGPALYLMRYIYNLDKIEREPQALLQA